MKSLFTLAILAASLSMLAFVYVVVQAEPSVDEAPTIDDSDVQTPSDAIDPTQDVKTNPEPEDYSARHVFITFRKHFLTDPDGEKVSLRSVWSERLFPLLAIGKHEGAALVADLLVEEVTLQQAFSSYIVVRTDQAGSTGYVMRELCSFFMSAQKKVYSDGEVILACEYSDKQVMFAKEASIEEMAKFKSKVKLQDDHDKQILSDAEKERKKK